MKKNNKEAARMAGYIFEFLHDYAPQFLTSSEHTLKSYRDALTLYIVFLEERDITHMNNVQRAFCLSGRFLYTKFFNKFCTHPNISLTKRHWQDSEKHFD